jgi:ATP-binding cassette subfamily B protein
LDSPILIFDDALSAVDTETEELIFNRLLKVRKNKTTIFISHRISTIQNADFIVVLDKGSIEEIGNHQQLLDNKKFYAEIYAMQKFEDKFEDNEL